MKGVEMGKTSSKLSKVDLYSNVDRIEQFPVFLIFEKPIKLIFEVTVLKIPQIEKNELEVLCAN